MATTLTATLGGKRLLDPRRELDTVVRRGYPLPPGLEQANCLMNPLGRAPGKAWVLLYRDDLDDLSKNGLHDLIFADQYGNQGKALDMCFASEPCCVTPGTSSDRSAAYLCELGDARWRCHNPYSTQFVVNKSYNVRAYAYSGAATTTAFFTDSLNAGSFWTWQTMVDSLWGMCTPLGSAPTLPATPDGTPEGWVFAGVSAYEALCDVLDRIDCSIKWNSIAGTYSIVGPGSADTATEAIITTATNNGRCIYDAQYLSGYYRGRAPAGVKVLFHRIEQYGGTEETGQRTAAQWMMNAVYAVNVAATDAEIVAGAETGSYHLLWDDLPAIYDGSGSLTNSAALTTRATERAANYYDSLTGAGGGKRRQRFAGVLPISPGGTLRGVAWSLPSQAAGLTTEVIRHPWAMLSVDRGGQWEECCCAGSTSIQSPAFGPSWPWLQHREPIIELASGTPSSGYYSATVEKSDGAGGLTDKESIWAGDIDALGSATATFTAGARFAARLLGYVNSRPMYGFKATGSGTGTLTGSLTNGTIPVATGTTTIGDSWLTQSTNTVTLTTAKTMNFPSGSLLTINTASATVESGGVFTIKSGGHATVASGGEITLASGSTVTVNGSATVGSGGTLTAASGSTTTFSGSTSIGATGTLTVNSGATTTFNNAPTFAGGMTMDGINYLGGTLYCYTSGFPAGAGNIQFVKESVGDGDPTNYFVPPNAADHPPASAPLWNGSLAVFHNESSPDLAKLYFAAGVDIAATDWHRVITVATADPGADRILFWDDSAGVYTWLEAGSGLSISGTTMTASGGSGISDGDYGDITVSSSGATWTIDNNVVTYAKIQDMTTSRLLGRTTGGSGDVEELTVSTGLTLASGSLSPTSATLYVSTASVTIATATTATLIGSGSGSLTLPASHLTTGKTIRVTARGEYTTTASPDTLIFTLKFGSTTVANTNNGTALAPRGSMSKVYWDLVCDITCRSTGGSGTVMAVGRVMMEASTPSLSTVSGAVCFLWSGTNPTTVTIDTTATQAVDLQCTDAGTGTSITCTNFVLESLY